MPVIPAILNGGATLFGPAADGSINQALVTDASRQLSFASVALVAGATTDHAIARFDGITGQVQNSSVMLADDNQITGVAGITIDNIDIDGNTIAATGDLIATSTTGLQAISTGAAWNPLDATLNSLYIENVQAGAGDGNLGAALTFSSALRVGVAQAAIAARQEGADNDHMGLSFFVHPSSTNNDSLLEAMRLTKDAHLSLGSHDGAASEAVVSNATFSVYHRATGAALSSDPTDVVFIGLTENASGDDSVAGAGARIVFKIPTNSKTAMVGAGVAGIRESETDTDTSGALAFYTSQNDEVLDEAFRIASDGQITGVLGITIDDIDIDGSTIAVAGAVADIDGTDLIINGSDGGAHSLNDPDGGDIIITPGLAGAGGAGVDGAIIIRNPGGTPGLDETQIRRTSQQLQFKHKDNGAEFVFQEEGGLILLEIRDADAMFTRMASYDLGTPSTPWGRLWVDESVEIDADNAPLNLGADADASILYDGVDMVVNSRAVGAGDLLINTGGGNVAIGVASADTILHIKSTRPVLKLEDNDPSVTASGVVGAIEFHQTDSDEPGRIGRIRMEAEAAVTVGVADFMMVFSTSDGPAGATDRMWLMKDGKLGVNEPAPHSKFHITGTRDAITLENNDGSVAINETLFDIDWESRDISVNAAGTVGQLRLIAEATFADNDVKTAMVFHTNTGVAGSLAEAMRITSAGSLVVGNTVADSLIHFEGLNSALTLANNDLSIGTNQDLFDIEWKVVDTDATGIVARIRVSAEANYGASDARSSMEFHTNSGAPGGTPALNIASDGKITIGSAFNLQDSILNLRSPNDSITMMNNDTSVSLGDKLFGLDWTSLDSSVNALGIVGQINVFAEADYLDNDAKSYMTFHTNTGAAGSPAEAMRISSGGLVGIGLTPITGRLVQIEGTESVELFVETKRTGGNTNAIEALANTSNAGDNRAFYANASNGGAGVAFSFYGNGGQFYNGGDAGFATDVPAEKIHVAGDIRISDFTEKIGGLNIRTAREVVTLTGASTDTTFGIPTGALLIGAVFNVDVAVVDDAGDDTWSAAYTGGSSTSLVSAIAAALNTKASAMVVPEVASSSTNIQFTPNGGNFTAGSIEVVAFYFDTTDLANA